MRDRVPRLSPELRERLELDRLRRRPAAPDERHPLRQQVQAYPSLLDQVLGSALEPDYVAAARRRDERAREAATGAPADDAATGGGAERRTPGRARLASVLVLAVFAVLVATAVRETAADAPTDALVRETLVREAGERRTELAELQSLVAETRRDNAELSSELRQARALRSEAVGDLRALAAAAGFQAVSGEGLRWTVRNEPDELGGDLVAANELAYLVNGLWEAGAEAIAVNGQRLTARSAITQSGRGINVNGSPLTAPFVVSVVGDPRTLESLFAETRSGYLWLLTVDTLGFPVTVERDDELLLPAAREGLLATCGSCDPEEQVAPGGQTDD
nr:DUF881 domain-containing protein [Nocardioides perillae]